MDETDRTTGEFIDEEEDARRSSVFAELKPYCVELLELLQNPTKHSSAIPALLQLFRSSHPSALQPFFDYSLFPLLLLLDAAVDCRSQQKDDTKENFMPDVQKMPQKVSDNVAEGVLQCLEELLKKCHLRSVDQFNDVLLQMVVVLKKLTYGALLSPFEASEEFREGVIKCFRALLSSVLPCPDMCCACKQIRGLPTLLESRSMETSLCRSLKYHSESQECLLLFLQSQTASAAVGHWLSLLLKAADTEATQGHRGSAKLRIEAFTALRVLVAKVGTADALAFFLPGVVSQFSKVFHASKTMISGAAGSVEAINQAIRGLAEYLMIVLHDDANLDGLDTSIDFIDEFNSSKYKSAQSFLDELRSLPDKAQGKGKIVAEDSSKAINIVTAKSEFKEERTTGSGKGIGSLQVNRTKDWIENTSAHIDKLLGATFPHICVHPSKKVRQGLLAAIRGLLSECSRTLKKSRLMLLECLFVLAVDDSDEVSLASQEFLDDLFLLSGKNNLEHDIGEIFRRLIEKLPKVVLGREESLALSHAQQLLVVIYYSGPQLVVDHLLHSAVSAAQFLDVLAVCLSQNSLFAGSLDKLISTRRSSVGYLPSIAELKAGTNFTSNYLTIMSATPFENSMGTDIREKVVEYPPENVQKSFEIPRMPPWFVYVGSPKLYEALAGILRLVDIRSEGHLSLITDVPLGYLRKLISEIRVKEYNNETWQSWYNRTGSGQLLRQASTAVCILNEMIFGLSDQAFHIFTRMFHKSREKREEAQEFDAGLANGQHHKTECSLPNESVWKVSQDKGVRSNLIDCVGRILHEYLSPEVWDLPVIVDGIGIFNICLGRDFASSGFLHSSLYLLLENLISSNFEVRSAADAVLHVFSTTSGYPTVGHLVLENADYVIDSICRQLRHLDLNPHVPNVLAAMLSYIGVAQRILPLLEEPMRSVSVELEILGRHQHPDLTIPFLKALAELTKASKHEACSLPTKAESYFMHVKSIISDVRKKARIGSKVCSISSSDDEFFMSQMESEQVESISFNLNDSKRYRRTVGSIAGSCITAATPLLASTKQAACLVALDIIEGGIVALAKVEEAYRHERETKEAIEEVIRSCSLYQLQDTLDAADEGTDENRLLPAMNKIWPFLVVCIQNRNPVAVRRCLSVISNVVQICGGDFFSRRFHTDGHHIWKFLTTSPFWKNPNLKQERTPLKLPYRSTSISLEESVSELTNLKVQIAVLNMIAELSKNRKSASALEVVLKKVSGIVVGIACSGFVRLQDATVNALLGLASIDPDLIWLLLADVYYSMKRKDMPSPPIPNLPAIGQILPPPSSPKEFLYVQYGGQSFDIEFSSVETVFKKLHSQAFTNQMCS
ncbi:telo2-interacting protein 1 like protein [Quercus suber]|uniref:Telo2-interacting protein 1 like protein n=1 Tax=Quercus suber TaxID=58331 RepID=A0AAW0M6C7_QUESU